MTARSPLFTHRCRILQRLRTTGLDPNQKRGTPTFLIFCLNVICFFHFKGGKVNNARRMCWSCATCGPKNNQAWCIVTVYSLVQYLVLNSQTTYELRALQYSTYNISASSQYQSDVTSASVQSVPLQPWDIRRMLASNTVPSPLAKQLQTKWSGQHGLVYRGSSYQCSVLWQHSTLWQCKTEQRHTWKNEQKNLDSCDQEMFTISFPSQKFDVPVGIFHVSIQKTVRYVAFISLSERKLSVCVEKKWIAKQVDHIFRLLEYKKKYDFFSWKMNKLRSFIQ